MKKEKILLTGATGFTGGYILEKLLRQKERYDISIFARSKEKISQLGYDKLPINILYGSFEETNRLKKAFAKQDILINIVSLGLGHTNTIIQTCQEENIKRGIFISTTSIFTKLNPKSKKIRIKAEKIIEDSNLDYTIIRPTMIYGTPKDRNMIQLIKFIKKYPIIPVFGSGKFFQQPIHVKDLAKAIVATLSTDKSINKTYNLSGAKPLTYNQIINIVANSLNKKIIKIHLPLLLSKILFYCYEKIFPKPKIKLEQILRLNEHKNFDHSKAKNDFGFTPRSFNIGIMEEIKEYTKSPQRKQK